MQPIGRSRLDRLLRDPAPSRLTYRLQRLWLTPTFRFGLRFGLPVLLLAGVIGWYLSDTARVEALRLSFVELRDQIEHRPEFMVKLMRIDNVSDEVAEDIREVTSIDFPVSSFDLDLKEMRKRIEGLDAVARAELVIRPGGILDVTVVERKPAIVWRSRDSLELLDASGHRVSSVDSRLARSDLYLIAGEGADRAVPEAMAIFRAAKPIIGRIRGLLRIGERRWDVILDRGQKIMLPEKGAVEALQQVLVMDGNSRLLSRDVSVVDVRNPTRPTLRLVGDALKNLEKNIRKPLEDKT
ncbi:MAG: cell division protein FtsQ/DivIB [Paracoccaceae bacterium]|nr:cell division protein FtsQ/DivIB [Paracoccaceae bacterium]